MCENPETEYQPLPGKPEIRGGEDESDITGIEEALQYDPNMKPDA